MEVRVSGDRRYCRFYSSKICAVPSDLVALRSTASRARASFGPGGRCCSAEIPAQAQVAPWARGSTRHAAGPRAAGLVALLWAEMAEHSEMISFLFSKNFLFIFDKFELNFDVEICIILI